MGMLMEAFYEVYSTGNWGLMCLWILVMVFVVVALFFIDRLILCWFLKTLHIWEELNKTLEKMAMLEEYCRVEQRMALGMSEQAPGESSQSDDK